MPPFGDSILILARLILVLGSLGAAALAGCRIFRRKKVGPVLALMAWGALALLMVMVVAGIIEGDVEYNPSIKSKEQLAGTYARGRQSLTLKLDGTYTATGFVEMAAGSWSHFDWNLTLSNARLEQPRVVTRNGVLCIAPFYAGVDDPPGILLKKEDD